MTGREHHHLDRVTADSRATSSQQDSVKLLLQKQAANGSTAEPRTHGIWIFCTPNQTVRENTEPYPHCTCVYICQILLRCTCETGETLWSAVYVLFLNLKRERTRGSEGPRPSHSMLPTSKCWVVHIPGHGALTPSDT